MSAHTRTFSPLRTVAAIGCLTALLLGGCQTTSPAPSPGRADPVPPPGNSPQISVLSPDLQPWIAFDPAYIERPVDAPMQVQTPMRNLTNYQYLVEYRYLFYDENGMELNPPMDWAMVPVDPKQQVRLHGQALSMDAAAHRLEVRWSR